MSTTTTTTETFADALRERLERAAMSTSALARQIGVTHQAVSLYLRGTLPSPATAARIREVLPGLEVPERRQGRPVRACVIGLAAATAQR